MRLSLVAVAVLSLSAFVRPAAALQQFVDVREIPADTLRDVAVTIATPGRPRIYYNPVLMQQIGPKLGAFVMTHEYGHVRYGHTGSVLRANESGKTAESVDGTNRRKQELEADCYAARILGETNPDAIRAAVQFFNTMGPFRYDSLHPAGAQRAAMIQACLTDGTPNPPAPPTEKP